MSGVGEEARDPGQKPTKADGSRDQTKVVAATIIMIIGMSLITMIISTTFTTIMINQANNEKTAGISPREIGGAGTSAQGFKLKCFLCFLYILPFALPIFIIKVVCITVVISIISGIIVLGKIVHYMH